MGTVFVGFLCFLDLLCFLDGAKKAPKSMQKRLFYESLRCICIGLKPQHPKASPDIACTELQQACVDVASSAPQLASWNRSGLTSLAVSFPRMLFLQVTPRQVTPTRFPACTHTYPFLISSNCLVSTRWHFLFPPILNVKKCLLHFFLVYQYARGAPRHLPLPNLKQLFVCKLQ